MSDLRFAIFGTGFWSRFQLAGWKEIPGAHCVALYNRTRAKAEALADSMNVPAVYDDPEALLREERVDFIDVITDVDHHQPFVQLAARHGIPVICQKPMAPSYRDARSMVEACRSAGISFLVHENWRWQKPIREVKKVLDSGIVGKAFRARIDYCCSFPVFDNQPFLKELDQFILTDIGSHILDVARFLFGEADQLFCQIHRVHEDIRGEDVATVMMLMAGDVTVTCHMSYASKLERERFPETFILIEAEKGSIELSPEYRVAVTTPEGTSTQRSAPVEYPWADPAYALVHSSIVDCNRDLFSFLQGGGRAETTGEDNLKTMELVFAAYESAQRRSVITFPRKS